MLKITHLQLILAACAALFTTTLPAVAAATGPRFILGGDVATPSEVYGTVVLGDMAEGSFEPSCTGTLVAPDVVLTATHCIVEIDEDTDEVLGVFDPQDIIVGVNVVDAYSGEGTFVDVLAVFPHDGFPNPGYDPVDDTGLGQENDIALLFLAEPVEDVDPIPMLTPEVVDSVLNPGVSLLISGYGLTDPEDEDSAGVLHLGDVTVRRRGVWEFTIDGDGDVDSCEGDSGGPAYVDIDGQLYVAGVTSRGVENSNLTCGAGGIYTLVPAYFEWMAEVTGGEFDPALEGGEGPDLDDDDDLGASDEGGGGDGCATSPGGHLDGALLLAALAVAVWSARRRDD